VRIRRKIATKRSQEVPEDQFGNFVMTSFEKLETSEALPVYYVRHTIVAQKACQCKPKGADGPMACKRGPVSGREEIAAKG
jgi:hypothetical protein